MTNKVSVIILTLNEEANISHALKSVSGWAREVIILDSGSTDRTAGIAKEYGASIYHRAFDNYAAQRNYAIQELPLKTDWVLFLDADEYLPDALKNEIDTVLDQPNKDGYYMKYRLSFMGKWLKYGGYYPTWILRLFRRDRSVFHREVNEHIKVDGLVGYLQSDFIHEDHKGIGDWINKHNKYATFEAEQLVRAKDSLPEKFNSLWGTQNKRKNWVRTRIWNKLMPPVLRPFVYFGYRYFFRLGFLDGREGFVFLFFHALWYQMLIDVKYLEMMRQQKESLD